MSSTTTRFWSRRLSLFIKLISVRRSSRAQEAARRYALAGGRAPGRPVRSRQEIEISHSATPAGPSPRKANGERRVAGGERRAARGERRLAIGEKRAASH